MIDSDKNEDVEPLGRYCDFFSISLGVDDKLKHILNTRP